jgi:hypothetical protein
LWLLVIESVKFDMDLERQMRLQMRYVRVLTRLKRLWFLFP